jgi:hypothetical protein
VQNTIGCESSWLRLTRLLDGARCDGHDVVRRRRGVVGQVDVDAGVLFCRRSQQGFSGLNAILNIFADIVELIVLVV